MLKGIDKIYIKANNKYVQKYNNKKPSKCIKHLDENNLYGWEMSQYLPYGVFKWLNKKEIDNFEVNAIGENTFDGYILEVDFDYPDELHELHNDYTLAPEKLKINHMSSNCCSKIANDHGIKFGNVNKLIPNLGNKSKYVLHYRNLKLHLSLGIKLTKVHKILGFKQLDWLKEYIDFNTDKRKNTVNSSEKDFLKMMINSNHGKTMETFTKRINVSLINNVKYYKKFVSKPSFVSQKIFSKTCDAIHEVKPVLALNKPIYVGFSILDLSKLLMYEFHYNYIKTKYKNCNYLLFTDTESLVYEIEANDVYEDFYEDKDLIFVIIQKIQSFLILSIKKLLAK